MTTSRWYKSKRQRWVFLILGLLWLGWLNRIFWVRFLISNRGGLSLWELLAFLILGWFLWLWRRAWKNIKYEVDKEFLKITLPSSKTVQIKKEQIVGIEKITSKPSQIWLPWWGFLSKNGQLWITTSFENLIKIKLKNWDQIVISPAKELKI